jgi:hypothetical protein
MSIFIQYFIEGFNGGNVDIAFFLANLVQQKLSNTQNSWLSDLLNEMLMKDGHYFVASFFVKHLHLDDWIDPVSIAQHLVNRNDFGDGINDFGQLWIWVRDFPDVRKQFPPEQFVDRFLREGENSKARFWIERLHLHHLYLQDTGNKEFTTKDIQDDKKRGNIIARLEKAIFEAEIASISKSGLYFASHPQFEESLFIIPSALKNQGSLSVGDTMRVSIGINKDWKDDRYKFNVFEIHEVSRGATALPTLTGHEE